MFFLVLSLGLQRSCQLLGCFVMVCIGFIISIPGRALGRETYIGNQHLDEPLKRPKDHETVLPTLSGLQICAAGTIPTLFQRVHVMDPFQISCRALFPHRRLSHAIDIPLPRTIYLRLLYYRRSAPCHRTCKKIGNFTGNEPCHNFNVQ